MNFRILQVEDSEVDHELFKRIVINCSIRWVRSTQEAYVYLHACADVNLPSIIFIDLNLPAENGIRLIHRLKINPQYRAIPIIVLSSISEQKEIDACYDAGANAFIKKTLRPQDLAVKLEAFMHFWMVAAHLPLLRGSHD
jgi:CheY-like chemotaxis protein